MKKIILLSNNENSMRLYCWLAEKGFDVKAIQEQITMDVVEKFNPDLVISYNYAHIVKEDVIDHLGDRIINMHISLLPWNRGSSPNIWSFIDDTPKGVTIHRLEKGLDTGKIILQKECQFDEDVETLSSSYEILNNEIVQLLIDNWELIELGNYELFAQKGKGTYHRSSDLREFLGDRQIDYSMTISDFKRYYL